MRPALLWTFGVLAALRIVSPLTVTVVQGHSMEPTMHSGGLYVLDRSYYRSHELARGDVVVLRHAGITYVKRVCAVPGDRLWLLHFDDGIGDEVVTASEAAKLRTIKAREHLHDQEILHLTIPPGHCFVVGDNQPVSLDSRAFGPVPISEIVGRAML